MKHVQPGFAAVLRTVTATRLTSPNGPAPLDTAPTGETGTAATGAGAPAGGGAATILDTRTDGQAPAAGGEGQRNADTDLLITPPAGAQGGSGEVATGAGASAGAAEQQAAAAATAAAQSGQAPTATELASLPADVQKLIADLRKENGETRVKAKTAQETAEAAAAEALKAKQEEWIGNLLKAAGLMPDVADQAAAELTPEQQIEALTGQLGQRDQDVQARERRFRDTAHELALWKGATAHDADPQRLADSVSFMRTVGELDPDASDYADQVSAAIAAAVAGNEHFKRTSTAVVTPPAVASGADGFAGGPRGGTSDEPQGIEAHRAALRERRGR